FTANVNATGGTPTGTVTFKDGAETLGTGTLSNGHATFTITTLAVGTHSIAAYYGGDSSFDVSTSAALNQTVSNSDSTTGLTSSVNPSVFGQSVTFTARVTASAGTPTGSAIFKDGSTTLGSVDLANGQAMFTISTLAVGAHSVSVTYAGDPTFASSAS